MVPALILQLVDEVSTVIATLNPDVEVAVGVYVPPTTGDDGAVDGVIVWLPTVTVKVPVA